MPDRTELRAAITARKPVAYILADGREWEFPPDVDADAFLSFIEQHGEEITAGGNLSLPATRDFFETVFGKDRFVNIRQYGIGWRELRTMAWTLYAHYMGVIDTSEGGDDDPPAETASPS